MNSRKLKRKKELQARKAAKKAGREVERKLNGLPKSCDECGKPFDRTNMEMISSWRVAVYDDGPIHLVCPDCVPAGVKSQG
tara:strand:- start:197 stop:439 length:243 start_codon:yes stop_codon:yes gene_type:complete